MSLLEKSMFFVPNRFYVHENEIHVSFNIAGIPTDMLVTAMTIKIPLPANAAGLVHLHEITEGWDELYIRHVRPSLSPAINAVQVSSGTQEAEFALTYLSEPWRFNSLENHGVYIRLESSEPALFTDQHMPYLLVSTV